MSVRVVAMLLSSLIVIATACGTDGGASDATQLPSSGETVPDDGITSVGELLSDAAPRDVVARGFVVWNQDGARLCEALAESFPPQCGGASVTIADPEALVLDLVSESEVHWTDLHVDLDAHFDGGQLILGDR